LETESPYIAGLEFEIHLPQPPGCWNYRSAPPCPAKSFKTIRIKKAGGRGDKSEEGFYCFPLSSAEGYRMEVAEQK
jgi:hypothetical protein